MNLLNFSNSIKKIISIILIFSITSFSHSALPAAVPVAVASIIGALNTSAGKKFIKKLANLAGFDDFFEDDDGNIVYISQGSKYCYNYNFSDYCANTPTQAKAVFNSIPPTDPNWKAHYCNYSQTHLGRKYNIDDVIKCQVKRYNDDGELIQQYFVDFLCQDCKYKTIDKKDIADEVIKRKDSDSDANAVYEIAKKREDDDNTNDVDDEDARTKCQANSSSTACSDAKNKNDDSDDKKNDDSDDKKNDDSDDKKNDDFDDELKCNSSQFHKKVCDWIDWTYDETDKAKKKISEFFDDDEALSNQKKDLKDLVEEKEPEDKKSNFDLVDACPASKTVTSSIMGRTISIEVFNFQGICKWAEFIEFGLNTTAMIIAFNIITGRRQD